MAKIAVAIRLLNENLDLQKYTISMMKEAASQVGCSLLFFATNTSRFDDLVESGAIDEKDFEKDGAKLISWCDALYVRNIGNQSRRIGRLAMMARNSRKPVYDPYVLEMAIAGEEPKPNSKMRMFELLSDAGIATPETTFVSWEELCEMDPDLIYGKVVKLNRGGRQGRGTYMMRKTKKYDKIHRVLDDLFENHHISLGNGVLIQQWIDVHGGDWRLMVVHGNVVGAFRRGTRKKTFQATTSEGKSKNVQLDQIPAALINMCASASQALGLSICSIDAVTDKSGAHWIIEVNEAPSFSAFAKKTGINPMAVLFDGIKEQVT